MSDISDNPKTFWKKLGKAYQFVTLLTIEPTLFVVYFLLTLKGVPTTQLIQDKICLNQFHLNASYCHALPGMSAAEDSLHRKSDVLSGSTNFSIYATLFMSLPGFFAGFFVGPWTDKYIKAKKIILIAGGLAGICESLILILNVYFYEWSPLGIIISYLPSCFTGGLLALFTAIFSYVTSTTPVKVRALRMAVLEVMSATAQPLGTYLGGKILNTTPILKGGQLYNYSGVYFVCLAVNVFVVIWTIFVVNEEKDTLEFAQRFGDGNCEEKKEYGCDKMKRFDEFKDIHPLKLLFNWANVKDMLRTCFKKRPANVRLQLWLLFGSMACFLLSHVGPIIFLYSFVQKVYRWNSETYSNVSAINNVVNALATFLFAPVLIKVLNLRDSTLVMIGTLSYFAQNMIRGTVLTPQGFYISILPGCLGAMAAIGLKTYFSKLISVKEQGKVFSLLSSIESIMPLIAAGFFTKIFTATMDTMPGLSFILTASLLIFPLVVIIWVHFFTKLPMIDEQLDINTEHVNEDNDDSKC